MPKVEACQTHYKINDYDFNDCTLIENMLSIYNESYYRREYIALAYDEDERLLRIPRGFPSGILEKSFKLDYLHINREFTEPTETRFRITSPPRDDDQRRIIAFLQGEKEYKYTKKYSQKAINLKPGKGKTYCALAHISLSKVKSIIIVHDTNVALQWMKAMAEHTDLKEKDIVTISGGDSIDRLMKQKVPKGKIYIAVHATLSAYASRPSNDWTVIDKVFTHLGIGIKVFDEAHKCFENIMRIDLYTNVKDTIYLSATLEKSAHKENTVFMNAFSLVPTFGKELITIDDIHAIALIMEYNTFPSMGHVAKCKKKQGFSSILYTNYLFDDMNRTRAFFDVLYEAVEFGLRREGKICILAATKDAGNTLKMLLEEKYPEVGKVGIFNSSITDREVRRKETDCRIFVTTSNSMTAAMDIYDLSFVIMTEPYSSLPNQEQLVGRLRPIEGRQLYYIELLNIGFKDMVKQHKTRRGRLKSLVSKIYDLKQKK